MSRFVVLVRRPEQRRKVVRGMKASPARPNPSTLQDTPAAIGVALSMAAALLIDTPTEQNPTSIVR